MTKGPPSNSLPRSTAPTSTTNAGRGESPPVHLRRLRGRRGVEDVAGLLAQSYTVISFDRRETRSRPPAGWSTTSLDEQADDAAALLRAVGGGPAFVYANSLGGAIGLRLLERHADLVRRRSSTSRG